MTLRELFEVMWSITELRVTARDPDGTFIHEWIYGPNVYETSHMYNDRIEGKLTIVKEKINAHGDPTRGGSEMGWGVKEKLIPKELLDAPMTHLGVINHRAGEYSVGADVTMQELTLLKLIPQEEVV